MSDPQALRSLRNTALPVLVIGLPALLLAALVIWPQLDIAASAVFFEPGHGFPLALNPFFVALHMLGVYCGWVLAVLFLMFAVVTIARKKTILHLDAKAWVFLLTALVVGPGLFANVVFKDHWGRARPYKVTAFEGTAQFTPAFVIAHECDHNCSFVAGDPSFGFFIPTLAYVVPRRKTRKRVFWGGIAFGVLLGIDRLVMGAHFLSDIISAAFLVLGTSFILHSLFYSWDSSRQACKEWFTIKKMAQD